jgi:tripartite-type tricarboxylate transporter receptor subunit TctC
MGQVLEFHRFGKMRVLAVTGPTRLSAAPELATAAELGFPDMIVTGSIGLLAPAGTQTKIIAQIVQATSTALGETGVGTGQGCVPRLPLCPLSFPG